MRDDFDKNLHDAINKEIESIPFNNSDRLWSKIEKTFDEFETPKKPKHQYYKIAAILILVFTSGIIFSTPRAESLPFGSFFRNFSIQNSEGTGRNIQFNAPGAIAPGENPPYHEEVTLDPADIVEIGPVQDEFIETSLEELASIHPSTLYVPKETLSSQLSKVIYRELHEENISTMLFYDGGAIDFSINQRKVSEGTGVGIYYDEQDTEVKLLHENGIEYLFLLGRYNIVTVNWYQYGNSFTLIGNLTVDQAMSVIRSINKYP